MRHSVFGHLVLATIVFSFLLISGVLLSSHFAVMQGITEAERATAPEVAEKVLQILKMEEKSLGIFTRDWGVWDDTYLFVQNGNEQYIQSNLMDDTLSSALLNLAFFVNTDGDIVYQKGYDYLNETEVNIPADVYQQLHAHHLLEKADLDVPITGILPLETGPLLVSVQGIYRSDTSGPLAGYLIFGRYLNNDRIMEISDNSVFPFEIIGPYEMIDQLVPDSTLPYALLNDSGDAIITYSAIPDIFQKPAYIVKTEIPFRSPYTPSLLILLIVTTSVICFLFLGLLILYYKRYFLRHLQELADILDGGDIHPGSDDMLTDAPAELTSLVHAVDGAALKLRCHQDELARTQEELAEAEERIRILFEHAQDAICVIEGMEIVDCNLVFSCIFQKDRAFFIGQDVRQLAALIDPRYSESFLGFIHQICNDITGGVNRFEWSFPDLSPSEKEWSIFDIIIREVRYHDSRLRFIIARDISRQVEFQQNQARLLKQLEENLVHMGTLNDQIRNPLTIISTLIDEDENPDKERILSEISRIDQLINRLDDGFISSEKVWAFLHKKRDYNFEDIDT